MEAIDYDLLAEKIAAKMNKLNPNILWSAKDIGEYLGKSSSPTYRAIEQPDFPEPVTKGDRSRRWLAGDVMKWATGKRPR